MPRKPKAGQPLTAEENKRVVSREEGEATIAERAEPQPEAFVTRNSGDDAPGPKKRRLGFDVTEDNQIVWESMRGKTKAELTEVLKNDPVLRQMLGHAVAAEAEAMITEENVRVFLGNLNKFNAWVSGQMIKRGSKGKLTVDPDILAHAYEFTDEQYKELCPRGARIANKWAPDWAKKYQDEFFFVLMYMDYVGQQTKHAVILQLQRNQAAEAERQQPKPNGHAQPQPVPEV